MTFTSCTWHINIDSILETFQLGTTSTAINQRKRQKSNRCGEQKELAELVQNAPPEDILSLFAVGDLIDWTVLQHMCIITCSPPAAKSSERLYPIHCACVEQGNKKNNTTAMTKRKRKRNKSPERRHSVEISEKKVACTLWLDKITCNKRYGDIIQRLSACQAGFARRAETIREKGARNADDIVWSDHQAYLDDVRDLAISADLKSASELKSRDHEEVEMEKHSGSLQEGNCHEKNPKRSSAGQKNNLLTQAVRNGGSVISKNQIVGPSKGGKKTSIAKKMFKQSRSKQENTSRLRAQNADHATHENLGTTDKPNQPAEKVFDIGNRNTDCAAAIVTTASTPLRRSSRKKGATYADGAVDNRISHSKDRVLCSKKATNETSVKSSISLSKSRNAEPNLENKSELINANHKNKSQSISALPPEHARNVESDISDISNLTSCPSSPLTPVSPPTPDNISHVYEAAKATHQSDSTSIITAPRDEFKDQERSSFCLQYMKPHIAETAYGLIQEALVDDAFALLVAVTLLNRTKGTVAVPIFFTLMSNYPTPEKLAAAPVSAIIAIIGRLGLQNNRAKSLIGMARRWWCDDASPRKDFRYRTLHYPYPGAGSTIRPGEVLSDEVDDPREGAFEIGHLPGVGPYALDSWRIFCRDMLRGLANGYNGEGAEADSAFEPEWKRVLPKDKELRGFLKWMWAKEGIEWDPATGEKRGVL